MKSFTGVLAALFSLHMEAEEPEVAISKAPSVIHRHAPPDIMMSSYSAGREPVRRPLLLAPPHKNPLEEMRQDPKFPKKYDVIIYNRRVPVDYIEGMLQRIFHQRTEYAAEYAEHADIIRMGPYTQDAARTKAMQARADAKDRGQSGLYVRCALSLKSS